MLTLWEGSALGPSLPSLWSEALTCVAGSRLESRSAVMTTVVYTKAESLHPLLCRTARWVQDP